MADVQQQQFCLKWNNYQSTLPHIFHRLWERSMFVDVSLIVEGKRIDCHKVILSACSSYFEQLLSEHATHPHPLILLHDIPFAALESLVIFMYKGEINVSHDQLSAVLKVADALKIKGLADSEAIYNFARFKLMSKELPKVTSSAQHVPFNYPFNQTIMPPFPGGGNGLPVNGRNLAPGKEPSQFSTNVTGKSNVCDSRSQKPPKKRCRQEESTGPLPPSPPISLGEVQNTEQVQPSSPHEIVPAEDCIKVELEEETDNELQIDESVGHSTPDCADSDSRSTQNTPVPDMDSADSDERTETAHSLAALATQGAAFRMSDQQLVIPKMPSPSSTVKVEKGTIGMKNGERSYTMKDLEEGIELVLTGHLTPAKAIAKFKVPRRTFFRRLSTVRKLRGIPSSKENSSEYLITGQGHSPNPITNDVKLSQLPVIVPGMVAKDVSFISNLTKVANKGNHDAVKNKKDKNLQGVMATGNVFSLLNVAATPNYEYYLNYFKLKGAQNKEIMNEGKDHIMDDNRNHSTSESALAVHNGSSK